MSLQILGGSTSQTVRLFIQDTSKTDGSGLTGLAHNTSGLTAYYAKGPTGAATAITLVSQTPTGAWTSGGFCAVDGTNMAGVYRLDIPNAALDSEVETIIMLRGAANMAPTPLRVIGGKLQANAVTVADKTGYSLSAGGVTGVTDGVWNAALSSYTVNGSFGARIMRTDSASAGNGAKVTGAGHVAADIHELQAGVIQSTHFSTGAVDANALASDAVVEIRTGLGLASANLDTQLSGIQSDTNDIQSRLPAALISGRMDSNVQAIAAGVVTQIQSGLSTLTAGQVNAEVLDVLATDLFGELAAVPGASSTLKDKIAFLFMLARNKVTQTSSTQTLFADNTTTPVAAATTSDVGGTFTRGEFA